MSLVSEKRVLLECRIRKHTRVFAASLTNLGRTSLIYHRIDIGDSCMVRQPMHRAHHEHIPFLKEQVDKPQNARADVPLTSLFASPTILVNKMDGSMRFCIDNQNLNTVTKRTPTDFPELKTFLTLLLALCCSWHWNWPWDINQLMCTLATAK